MSQTADMSQEDAMTDATTPDEAGEARKPKLVENPTEAAGLLWFALAVTAQHEKAIFWEIRDIGFEAFCPVRTKYVRVSSKPKRRVERQYPLLPRYLFVGFDGAPALFDVCTLDHVKGVLGVDGPLAIPTAEIQRLMDRQAKGEWRAPEWQRNMQIGEVHYRAGDRVRVDLPGQDGEFVIESMHRRKAILRGLGLLGAQVVKVDVRRLEPVEG
jgi:transcription antitermination factor NusG